MTEQTSQIKKIYIDLELSKRLTDDSPRIKLEAGRELILCNNVCRSTKVLFRRCKFEVLPEIITLSRGQYFTTYKLLSQLWGCTVKGARYQVSKWVKCSIVTIQIIKSVRGFDLGLIVSYNPVFLEHKNRGIRESTQTKGQNEVKTRVGAPISNTESFLRKEYLEIKTNKKVVRKFKENTKKKEYQRSKTDFSFKQNIKFRKTSVKLTKFGFSNYEIQKIYKTFDLKCIQDHLQLVNLKIKVGKVRNPKAFLISSLNQSFDISEVLQLRFERKQDCLNKKLQEQENQKKYELEIKSNEIKRQKENEIQDKIRIWKEANQDKFKEIINEVQASGIIKIKPNQELSKVQLTVFQAIIDSKILKFIDSSSATQQASTTPSVSNHFMHQFVGVLRKQPERLEVPRIGAFTSKFNSIINSGYN